MLDLIYFVPVGDTYSGYAPPFYLPTFESGAVQQNEYLLSFSEYPVLETPGDGGCGVAQGLTGQGDLIGKLRGGLVTQIAICPPINLPVCLHCVVARNFIPLSLDTPTSHSILAAWKTAVSSIWVFKSLIQSHASKAERPVSAVALTSDSLARMVGSTEKEMMEREK
ncbi:hypothetical protein EYF80_010623 [Liparis tanakae]|uniref:Uncharacterized protein n=1 Tax=Liparis tanakae TaxID=230148 RepID=A0A4Z2IMU3_9TELE|nr:hypothetical protein EYF80_010623 [Liparis tanakae]